LQQNDGNKYIRSSRTTPGYYRPPCLPGIKEQMMQDFALAGNNRLKSLILE
jgi:hypothetical protein